MEANINNIEGRKTYLRSKFIFTKNNIINGRAFSLLIDILITGTLSWIIIIPINAFAIASRKFWITDPFYSRLLSILIFSTLFIVYSLLESSRYRGTLGQILFGIKILNKKNKRINIFTGIKRGFLKLLIVPIFLPFFPLALFMDFFFLPFYTNLLKVKVYKRN